VPVGNQENSSTSLLLWPFNGYGYWIRFDENGLYAQYKIDFSAIVFHLIPISKKFAW